MIFLEVQLEKTREERKNDLLVGTNALKYFLID